VRALILDDWGVGSPRWLVTPLWLERAECPLGYEGQVSVSVAESPPCVARRNLGVIRGKCPSHPDNTTVVGFRNVVVTI
jgi:hypothetical protein